VVKNVVQTEMYLLNYLWNSKRYYSKKISALTARSIASKVIPFADFEPARGLTQLT